MFERETFEREVGLTARAPAFEREVTVKRCGKFYLDKQVPGACDVKLTHPDGSPVVTGRFYQGGSEVVLLVGGMLGNSNGVDHVFQHLRAKLDGLPAKALKRSFFLIPNLFDPLRWAGADPARVAAGAREVEVEANFPLGGEGDDAVQARGGQLVDPDPRRFPGLPPQHLGGTKAPDRTANEMLPEIRVLVRFVGCAKPAFFCALHDVTTNKKRRVGPGLFVYPRGGIDTSLDAVLAGTSADPEDALAGRLLDRASARVSAVDTTLVELAFAGNRPLAGGFETVHGSPTARARGTHFATWTSVPVTTGSEKRPGAITLRLALPRDWTAKAKLTADGLGEIWAEELIREMGGTTP